MCMVGSRTVVRQEVGRALSHVPNPAVDVSRNMGRRLVGTRGGREALVAAWAMRWRRFCSWEPLLMPMVGSGCSVVGRAVGVGKMPCPRRLVHSLGYSHAPQDSRSSRRVSTHAWVAVLHGSGLAAAPQGTWVGTVPTVLRVCTGELSAATTEAAAKTEATKA